MNTFYQQHIALQWGVAIILAAIGFLPVMAITAQGIFNPLYYLLILLYLPVGQFSFTPIFALTGVYKYYSPMLLGYLPNDKVIDLHSGSSFDYLFVFVLGKGDGDPSVDKLSLRKRILAYHFMGLLNLIQRIEDGEIPDSVEVSGTSYFFNERTAQKLGFSLEAPTTFYRINLYANFIDIFWMYSLSQGRLTFPRLGDAKKITTTGRTLVTQKETIQRYVTMLTARA